MAARADLNMYQNIHRRLRTGLFSVPVQWRALRRVPPWLYAPQPVKRIQLPYRKLYEPLFERLPMLRLEGHRLGDMAAGAQTNKVMQSRTGKSAPRAQAPRSLTQRMVLRWHHLINQQGMGTNAAFQQVRQEHQHELDEFAAFLTKAKEQAEDRHKQLREAKAKRDEIEAELGRPERYSETLEALVDRSLHLPPRRGLPYFSDELSRKLTKFINKQRDKESRAEKAIQVRRMLEQSEIAQRMRRDASRRLRTSHETPTDSLPMSQLVEKDENGEPIPSPSLFYLVERETSSHNVPRISPTTGERIIVPRPLGHKKDRSMAAMYRHLDGMLVDEDASLADYLAYVLHTQIVDMGAKRLMHWEPYTAYLDSKVFFHAYRLLKTAPHISDVVLSEKDNGNATSSSASSSSPSDFPLSYPKVRSRHGTPLNFQQALTHSRLLGLIESHLQRAPLQSFKEFIKDRDHAIGGDTGAGARELPLTPFWQEMIDEKIRYKHPGEGWYNARIEERKRLDSEMYEEEKKEVEAINRWRKDRFAKVRTWGGRKYMEQKQQQQQAEQQADQQQQQ